MTVPPVTSSLRTRSSWSGIRLKNSASLSRSSFHGPHGDLGPVLQLPELGIVDQQPLRHRHRPHLHSPLARIRLADPTPGTAHFPCGHHTSSRPEGPRRLGLDLRRLHDERDLQVHVVLDDPPVAHDRPAVQDIDARNMAQRLRRPSDRLLRSIAPALVRHADEFDNPDHSRGLRVLRLRTHICLPPGSALRGRSYAEVSNGHSKVPKGGNFWFLKELRCDPEAGGGSPLSCWNTLVPLTICFPRSETSGAFLPHWDRIVSPPQTP